MRRMLAALALAGLASCGVAGTTGTLAATGPATWHTENSGTTNTLYDVGCLTAMRCFAVGDAGTLLATTDGGRTWHHEASPVNAPLYRVACALPASCYLVARPATILVTHDAGAHWAVRTLPVHVPGLALAGCVVGTPTAPQGETPCRLGLLGISCPSASTCYAVATTPGGYSRRPSPPEPGAGLWLTRNGGASWTPVKIPPSVVCNGDCNVPYGYPLEWVSCSPGGGPCWAGGNQLVGSHSGFAAALLVTQSPGGPWRLQPGCPAQGPCGEPVTDVGSCPSSTRCYAVNNSSPFGDGSTVASYTPAGKQSPGATVPVGVVINDIACPAARACFTAGNAGTILRTLNGTTFTKVKAPSRENLNGIACVTATACYAVGAAGAIEALRPG